MIERGDYRLENGIAYCRLQVILTPSQFNLMSTIAQRHTIVSVDALLQAIGSDAYPETVKTLLNQARARFVKAGIPFPVKNVKGQGYRWVAPEHDPVRA